jgi:hypothetical protein
MPISADEHHESDGEAIEPSRESIEQLDRLLLQQTLEATRAASSTFSTTETALVIVLVTLLGVAIDRQSWGLSLVSSLVYPIIALRLRAYRAVASALLNSALSTERRLRGGTTAMEVIPALISGVSALRYLVFVIWVTFLIHLPIALGLMAWGSGWSFAGG